MTWFKDSGKIFEMDRALMTVKGSTWALKLSNLQPMPMPSTTESPGQLPWGTRVYHHKACSKTCWSCPGALPTGKDHAPLPCPRQAGCNTKASTKQNTCPQSISSTNQGQAPWASPSSNQPFSTTKMGGGWSCRLCSGDTS